MSRALVEHRTHTMMVWLDGSMAFVTDLDVVAAAQRAWPFPTAGELAGSGLAVIRADESLERAASLVAETAAGHVVAADANGFPVGIVSTQDVVRAIVA